MSRTIPRELTKEKVLKQANLTIGDIKRHIEKHNLSDDTVVVVQRIEDSYFLSEHDTGWGVYYKDGLDALNAREHNRNVINGVYLDKAQYNDHPKHHVIYTEDEIKEMFSEQYIPTFCVATYKDELDILFINIHY